MTDVAKLVERLGLGFTLRGRCEGGMQGGAWLLERDDGTRAVLKLCGNQLAPRIVGLHAVVDRLRRAGYPTPAWLASGMAEDGIAYHVADFVPGAPSTPLTPAKTRLLLEVLETQAGLDPCPERDWSAHVAHPDPSQVPLSLVAAFTRLAAKAGPVTLPRGDLVHGDFNSCNIFVYEERVTGIIDVEALGSGSRVIDYAWLLREAYLQNYGPEVIAMIRLAGEAVAGPAALIACMAATVYDIVRFKLRHQPDTMEEVIAGLHLLATDLADGL